MSGTEKNGVQGPWWAKLITSVIVVLVIVLLASLIGLAIVWVIAAIIATGRVV